MPVIEWHNELRYVGIDSMNTYSIYAINVGFRNRWRFHKEGGMSPTARINSGRIEYREESLGGQGLFSEEAYIIHWMIPKKERVDHQLLKLLHAKCPTDEICNSKPDPNSRSCTTAKHIRIGALCIIKYKTMAEEALGAYNELKENNEELKKQVQELKWGKIPMSDLGLEELKGVLKEFSIGFKKRLKELKKEQ
ncbi:hypothetical protein CPB84DRAFT_1753262 [Gymnopilus junonius]|uniref:Uncharacterized protein n=1 Tax=Gymnopilus junonius TaxID=109634 RepID=A0A9P5TGV2_GYMJU|nr:hypothetical protein CPB84DRAFT_1753262 [Gymnopilus junonius]